MSFTPTIWTHCVPLSSSSSPQPIFIPKVDADIPMTVLKKCHPLLIPRLHTRYNTHSQKRLSKGLVLPRIQQVCQDLYESIEHFDSLLAEIEKDLGRSFLGEKIECYTCIPEVQMYKRSVKRREPDHIFLRSSVLLPSYSSIFHHFFNICFFHQESVLPFPLFPSHNIPFFYQYAILMSI